MKNFNYLKYKKFQWSNDLMLYVSQIHEFKGREEGLLKQKPSTLAKLQKTARLNSVKSSNYIEGIRTTDKRLKEIFDIKTFEPKTSDEEQMSGYREALDLINENYEYIPIKPSYILQLHKILYKYSPLSYGGKFKTSQNYISEIRPDGKEGILFTPLNEIETPIAIEQLCENFNRVFESGEVDALILIPIFIIDFLCIHPFNDGNGRMSRLLTNLLLLKAGYKITKYISIESIIDITSTNYYQSLAKANKNWHEDRHDIFPFIEYMLGVILSAYRSLSGKLYSYQGYIPAIDLVKKAVDQFTLRFTKKDIQYFVPQLKNTSIVLALKKLIEEGKIEKHGVGKKTFYIKLY